MTAPRAAKVCQREPTADMHEAGWHGFVSVEDTGDARSMLGAIWRAMYDAAPEDPSDDAPSLSQVEYDALVRDAMLWRAKQPSDDALVTELNAIIARGKTLSPNLIGRDNLLSRCRDRICALTTELAQAREDARRYRWLRDRLHAIDYEYGEPHVPVLVFEYPQGQAVGPGRALDAAIDAALAEQEGK